MPEPLAGTFLADVTRLGDAVSRIASWAIDTTQEIASLRDEVARHRRGIDALTERLDNVQDTNAALSEEFAGLAALGDVDSLRAEMLSRTATPFDA